MFNSIPLPKKIGSYDQKKGKEICGFFLEYLFPKLTSSILPGIK